MHRSLKVEVNDFPAFFAEHPRITHVFFNGGTSEKTFKREALPSLSRNGLVFGLLPSTSPAHAAMPFSKKVEAWLAVKDVLKQG
jgi:double-stranded uracil-DNA glycosylase